MPQINTMTGNIAQQTESERLKAIIELIHHGLESDLQERLDDMHPAEIAHLLESLPPEEREVIWQLVDLHDNADLLLHVNEDIRNQLIEETDDHDLIAVAQTLDTDDLADIIIDLPQDVTLEVLKSMDEERRRHLESMMSYPEDSAGGLMNTDTITVRADISLDVVHRYLRLRGEIPEMTDKLYVVNREGKYLGTMPLSYLLTEDPSYTVAELMSRETEAIGAETKAGDVANLFEKRDLVSAPVVNAEGMLLGRITIDDVVDVIRDQAEHSMLSMAGLNEEDDMFSPVVRSSRRRAIWLGFNLLTALLASWVIGQFEQTIEKLVALAVLMPIVASMGGIAGSQTLTLVIRGIALGHVGSSNARRLLYKELAVGALNGVLWALFVSLITFVWFEQLQLSVIIGVAMLLNLIVAAFAGASIPMIMHKIGIDPALAGGVVLTTVTDVVGFLVFLGLASILII